MWSAEGRRYVAGVLPAAPERIQVIHEMQRLSTSGERERYVA